jgi:hypothetical protein
VQDYEYLPSIVYSSVEENQESEQITSYNIATTPHGSPEPMSTTDSGPRTSFSLHISYFEEYNHEAK